jgi:hypothetical protein
MFAWYREMQMFLLGFIVIEICEIFTVGGIPLDDNVRKVGTRLELNASLELVDEIIVLIFGNRIGLFSGPHCGDHRHFMDPTHERACRLPAH